ncbi:transglycosylase SLT domain-containing protein [Emticicia soli]|uniref:Transglycosylase SLT domain-containing protein n=1 Tax=Emticicia soli TaxID=2027878 RepID=A0ABW5J9I6_9BACT
MALAYIDKVTSNRAAFEQKVTQIASRLGIQADWLMVVMYAESKLNHLAQNPSSSAVGLIQFLDKTLAGLGINRTQLLSMSNVQQLDYVEKYFVNLGVKGKMKDVYQVCLAVFLPKHMNSPDSTVIAQSGTNTYNANKGMDIDKDGVLSVGDVRKWYGKYVPANVATGSNTVDVTLILTGIAVLYLVYQWSNTTTPTTTHP